MSSWCGTRGTRPIRSPRFASRIRGPCPARATGRSSSNWFTVSRRKERSLMVKSTRFAATVWSAVALSTVLGAPRLRHAAEPTPPHRQTVPAVIWHFDSLTPGQPPAGFVFGRTGGGRVGRWIVQSAPDAPSPPNVLAQVDSDRTDYRFPVAAAPSPTFTDGTVSVKCKPVSGHVDRACGLVFRDRKSTRLNSSHTVISYAVCCLKKKNVY